VQCWLRFDEYKKAKLMLREDFTVDTDFQPAEQATAFTAI
jgi:hypothetical protein